jgi:replicative DNA helicase
MTEAIQQVPHSREAEEAVIGGILINPECLREIDLTPDEFYNHSNQWIFETCQELYSRGKAVDYLTVTERLDERGQLSECGGPARLTGMIQSCPSSMHVPTYAEKVRNLARRRQVLAICNQLARSAYDFETDVNQFIPDAIDRLARSVIVSEGAVHISQFMGELYDEIEEASRNPKDIFGITTGCYDYDLITGGIQKGEVVKLIGDPGAGKSLLAFQWACEMAKQEPGAVYELEMRGLNVVRRRVSAISEVRTKALRSGRVKEDEWPKITAAIEEMSNLDIYMSDRSDWTTMALRVDLERLISQYHIGWFILDYEGLLCDEAGDDDTARSKVVSSRLHAIIKDLNLGAVVIDEMVKAGMNNPNANKSNMAGSGRKVHDADTIILLKNDPSNKNRVFLTWDKFREDDKDQVVTLIKKPGFPCFGNSARLP